MRFITPLKTFGLALQKEVAVVKSSVSTTGGKSTTATDSFSLTIQSIGLVASIVVAIAFCKSIKNKIHKKEEFSGAGWGIANGILGIGILWVIIAHNSINKEIEKIKDKEYKQYAKFQMKDFVLAYSICLIIWMIIIFIISTLSR